MISMSSFARQCVHFKIFFQFVGSVLKIPRDLCHLYSRRIVQLSLKQKQLNKQPTAALESVEQTQFYAAISEMTFLWLEMQLTGVCFQLPTVQLF